MQWQPATDDETARFRRSKRQEGIRAAVVFLCLQELALLAATVAVGLFLGEFLGRVQTPFGSMADVGMRFGQLVFLALLIRAGLRFAAAWRQTAKAIWYATQGVCTDLDRKEEYTRDYAARGYTAYRKGEWLYMVIQTDSGKKVYKQVPDDTCGDGLIGRRVTMATTTPDKIYPEFVCVHPPRPE